MLERRPVAPGDEAFLRELYATTRSDLAELPPDLRVEILDLQFRAQRHDWELRFPGAVHDLVLLDGRAIGRVWVAWLPGECRLIDISLLPLDRGRGIGARVVEAILARADVDGVCVRATVERVNAPARALWERLGFETVTEGSLQLALERPLSRARPQPAPV